MVYGLCPTLSANNQVTMTPISLQPAQFFDSPSGDRIAYRHIKGDGPTIFWCGGFLSDMWGAKIEAMTEAAHKNGWDFICFDYYAHGETGGAFDQATIGRWATNVFEVADHLTSGPLVVMGSSMGGWMATLLMKHRPERVMAAGLIAPAPDFVSELIWPRLLPEEVRALSLTGVYMMPGYDRDVPLTQAFFTESKAHNVLNAPLSFDGPVIIMHGDADKVVPLSHGQKLYAHIKSPAKRFDIIKDGDHRLSSPEHLSHMLAIVSEIRH